MNKTIKIGTRGSKLALYQAERTQKELSEAHPDINFEIKIIKTKGDIIQDVALSKIGDKGLFTKEIEVELLAGDVDLAVHSLKDLPTRLPEGLEFGGVLERGEFRDALVSNTVKSIDELTPEHIVATSSLRRKASLLRLNPNLNIIDIRGNVQTRLRKLDEGYCDATIMAAAGLQRMGLENRIAQILEPDGFIPAVSQGAIAIEIREGDKEIKGLLKAVNHEPTLQAVTAERIVLRELEGGCQVPVGCYTIFENGKIQLSAFVSSVDGSRYLREDLNGDAEQSEQLAYRIAEKLLEKGAKEILNEIRKLNG